MLSSIKPACDRQNAIDCHNQTIKPLVQTPEKTGVVVNHFEKILKNWVDIHTQPAIITLPNGQQMTPPSRPVVDERFTKEVSIPILPTIDSSKYDEWNTIFTTAGYVVKKDQYRFTVSMP